MSTITLPITILPKQGARLSIEIDRNRFERLADSLGLFNTEFLESVDRAEADIRSGRTKKLRSLRDLHS